MFLTFGIDYSKASLAPGTPGMTVTDDGFRPQTFHSGYHFIYESATGARLWRLWGPREELIKCVGQPRLLLKSDFRFCFRAWTCARPARCAAATVCCPAPSAKAARSPSTETTSPPNSSHSSAWTVTRSVWWGATRAREARRHKTKRLPPLLLY